MDPAPTEEGPDPMADLDPTSGPGRETSAGAAGSSPGACEIPVAATAGSCGHSPSSVSATWWSACCGPRSRLVLAGLAFAPNWRGVGGEIINHTSNLHRLCYNMHIQFT